ncbi:MAG: hypothetical protein EXR98_21875 [Gemmataceae bacterium]|nr:hypothetical protein [Gemmataceae bacterium]
MSKKPKIVAERPLHERIAKARKEGRTQQALDFARQYYKFEQTEERRELLRQVTLERGQQLQSQNSTRDASSVYANALTLGGPPEYVAIVAQRLAMCGAIPTALSVLNRLPEPAQRQRVIQHVADVAVTLGPACKNHLPLDLHGPFELILQAFAHYEANRDEEARTALQGIGLQSPFLEWKVFLRGLLAYYTKDDSRALENWQRLDATRLPHRLTAPMRAGIDPGFLHAQPDAVQQTLRGKLMQQQGASFAPALGELREMLYDERLAPAFRKAEAVVPILKREFPDLLPRFAHCFWWAIIDHGEPADIDRYLRLFDAPADDPDIQRLEALALETRGMWPEAHKAWKSFIDGVAGAAGIWPGESCQRVQALIWTRMAENALPNRKRRSRSGNPLFDLFASQTGPLKPSAEQCLENAIKLAPDRLDCYRALFEIYRHDHKRPKAKKLGQELLKRFPDHAETLDALGELCLDMGDFKRAQEYFEKSIQANPLDRSLRGKLAHARQVFGLALTVARKYDQAREQYEHALRIWDGAKTPLLCQWAVAEMKANNPVRADELVVQALDEPDQRLACRYALVGESVRAKLSASQKKQIALDLKLALAQTPTPAEILVLLEGAAQQRLTHDAAFHGQKTQEKTILKFLEGIRLHEFNEAQLERLCTGLGVLQVRKPWLNCLTHGRRQFVKSVFFRLAFADYYLIGGDPYSSKVHLAREHLDAARRLVEKLPPGEQQQQYVEQIKEKEKTIAEMNARSPAMMDVLDRMFGGGFGPPLGDEEDDFFDYEDEDF